jgi:hypothetical protein
VFNLEKGKKSMTHTIEYDNRDHRWHIHTEFGSDTGKSYGRFRDAERGLARMFARM